MGKKFLDKHPGLENWMSKEMVIGIRPSDLEAAQIAGHDPERSMNVTVEVTEMLGADTYIHFTVNHQPVVTPDIEEILADSGQTAESLGDTTNFVARVSPDVPIKHGDSLELTVDSDKLLFFDPDSGSRIGVEKKAPATV